MDTEKNTKKRALLYLQRALYYATSQDSKHALRDTREAMRLASSDVDALTRAAHIFTVLNMPEKAVRVLDAALHRAPTDSQAQHIHSLRIALQPRESALHRLPVELMVHVFGYLSFASLFPCMQVCRAWRRWITRHSPLWHTIHVKAASGPPSADPVVLRAQSDTLKTFVSRSTRHLSHLSLTPPLTNMDRPWRILPYLRLTSLYIECDYTRAAAWFAWAMQLPKLHQLTIQCTASKFTSPHPWLGSPMPVPTATPPLTHLSLFQTPPLREEHASLCSHLHSFVYDAGPSMQALQDVRERAMPIITSIVRACEPTLQCLDLGGGALRSLPTVPNLSSQPMFPYLEILKAPWTLVWPLLTPHLRVWECQLAGAGTTTYALMELVHATRTTLEEWNIRLTSDTRTQIVDDVLAQCTNLHTLRIYVDEATVDPPGLLTPAAAMASVCTPALLLQLLTPGALHHQVRCPKLQRIEIHNDTSVRGRELMEMVGIRTLLSRGYTWETAWKTLKATSQAGTNAPVSETSSEPICTSLSMLDIDTCIALSADVIPFVQRHVPQVMWSPTSVRRAQMAARRYQEPRTFRARAL